jgi:hypothetical protein
MIAADSMEIEPQSRTKYITKSREGIIPSENTFVRLYAFFASFVVSIMNVY